MKKFKFDLNPTSMTLDPSLTSISVGYLGKAIEETKGKLADNMRKLADNMQKFIEDEAQRLVTGAAHHARPRDILSLDEAREMLDHPNCRCAPLVDLSKVIEEIEYPTMTREVVDVFTAMGDAYVVPGLRRMGPLKMTVNMRQPDLMTQLHAHFLKGTAINVNVHGVKAPCKIISFTHEPSRFMVKLVLQPMPENKEPVVQNKLKKIRNKFYVASPNVTKPHEQEEVNTTGLATNSVDYGKWTRPTLDAAIDHARQQLESQPNLEHVAIVKIVKIVRRKAAPIVVEDVK